MSEAPATHTAFLGDERIASGPLRSTLRALRERLDRDGRDPAAAAGVLIFDDRRGRQIDVDLRGELEAMLEREAPAPAPPGPGRPRLGVVSREVTLLPRHWAWLELHPSGASAALRRLVDEARKRDPEGDRARLAAAAAGRFMTAMAGDRPGFEEAYRALDAGDRDRFEARVAGWPRDVRDHALRLADDAFGEGG